MKTKKFIFPIVLAAIFFVLMLVATFFDLMITQGLFKESSVFADIVTYTSEIPAYCIFPYLVALLGMIIYEKKHKTAIKNREMWIKIGIIWTVFFILAVAFASLAKVCWGRVRYVDIDNAAGNAFTSWYQLQGNTGNKSFFSGHAMLSTIVYLPLFCFEELSKSKKAIIGIAGTAFVVTVAFGRMVGGYHYLSDVVVGIFLGIGIMFIVSFVVKKMSKSGYSLQKRK